MAGTWLSVAAALAEGDAARRVVSLASAADTGDDEAAIGRGGNPRVSRATEAEGVTCARCKIRGSPARSWSGQRVDGRDNDLPADAAPERPVARGQWQAVVAWPDPLAPGHRSCQAACLVFGPAGWPISAQSPRAKEHLGVCPRSRRSNGLPRHRSAVREHEACI